MDYQGSFIKHRCVRQRLGIRVSDGEKAWLVWQIQLFVHDSSLPAFTTSPDEQREVSHTSGLGCVIYFTQLNMGKSDTVPQFQDKTLRGTACFCSSLLHCCLPFTVKECAQADHCPFNLGPKIREMNPTPSLDLTDLQTCSEKNLLFYPLGITHDTASLQQDPMDCSPPGSSGIFQGRILEWVAMPFSRGSS